MVTTLNTVSRFPPDAVAIKIAISLAAGMVVGLERESANKDVGTRTFGLTSLFATLCMLISPQFAMIGMGAVILVVAFLNARSLVASSSLEITTSIALLVTYILRHACRNRSHVHASCRGYPNDPIVGLEG